MQAMIPCNVAMLTIAALFYAWRDLYVPRRREQFQMRERAIVGDWPSLVGRKSEYQGHQRAIP